MVAGLLVSGGESADTPDGQRLIKAMTHLNKARTCFLCDLRSRPLECFKCTAAGSTWTRI